MMRRRHLETLTCLECMGGLTISSVTKEDINGVEEGWLRCTQCCAEYPIRAHIARFSAADNYAESFGLQWGIHSKTQIDSFNGTTLSYDRFFGQTEWRPDDLKGAKVLEAGCGAGRFTQVVLDSQAEVYSFDYSNSVDACLSNSNYHRNLCLVQADIYRIPFPRDYFDKVFCFGVLQHTPQPRHALSNLVSHLRPGGEIVVDLYPLRLFSLAHPRHVIRPITRFMKPERLYKLVAAWAPTLLSASQAVGSIPLIGTYLSRAIPVANYKGRLPLSDEAVADWAVLNTFDWLSPRYEKAVSSRALWKWLEGSGLEGAEVTLSQGGEVGRGGVYVGRGTKP